MGYESKIVVVEKHDNIIENNKKYAEKIAEFNLCKVYSISNKFREYLATDCYYYDDSGKKVTEDLYGEPLKEIPFEDAIHIIDFAIRTEDYYRRCTPCLEMLKGFNISDWRNLVVLHYGY